MVSPPTSSVRLTPVVSVLNLRSTCSAVKVTPAILSDGMTDRLPAIPSEVISKAPLPLLTLIESLKLALNRLMPARTSPSFSSNAKSPSTVSKPSSTALRPSTLITTSGLSVVPVAIFRLPTTPSTPISLGSAVKSIPRLLNWKRALSTDMLENPSIDREATPLTSAAN